ncbi:hypothetical protein Prum_007630 [Phytohabitans rumicis]|uniref:Ricin B lectin domain-containing protein n=1 Tax=Phytohabitans rumicis TaxID=1076125 RepID=A0A6V8KXG7_9ACTN|nr:hypothetical protein Prum_007630 [Phytohabitans rumicis]
MGLRSGPPEQLWYWTDDHMLKNLNSGKCIHGLPQGYQLWQDACGSSDKVFEKISAGAGKGWYLRNLYWGAVIAVANGSSANGTWIVLWRFTGGQEQRWKENHI